MNHRSDIFTVRNILTLVLLVVLMIGFYSYHNVNHRLSSSSKILSSIRMQMDAADKQLRSAIKTRTACFKDVMQLRATTIDMKTKLSEAETELAKEKHDSTSKLMRCSEEKKEVATLLNKMQSEVQSLKEEDRNKVQKKKDEEEEKDKKLKEMIAEHELKVSKLKDAIADLQKENTALQEKLNAAVVLAGKSGGEKTLSPKSDEKPKKIIEDNSIHQVRPPAIKSLNHKKQQGSELQPSKTKRSAEIVKSEKVEEAKKLADDKIDLPKDDKKDLRNENPEMGDLKKYNVNKEQSVSHRRARGPGLDEEDKEGERGSLLKEPKRGQQLDMPLPRDAVRQNKEPNQLPNPAGVESELKENLARARPMQPSIEDDGQRV